MMLRALGRRGVFGRFCFTFLSLILSSVCTAETRLADEPLPLCVLDPARMPESWRPSAEQQQSLNPASWSESEAKDAAAAIEAGADEMIDYFARKPSAVEFLWDDSIEALVNPIYASANPPALDAKLEAAARRNLTALVTPYLERDPDSADCEEFESLLPLAIFAQRFHPAGDARRAAITKHSNAAYQACGALEDAVEYDFDEILVEAGARIEDPDCRSVGEQAGCLFDLTLWSIWFTEAQLYPEIELPEDADEFPSMIWNYLKATYRLAGAGEFEKGAWDEDFIEVAYLATHIAHMPTGTHRFPLYIEHSPALYRFHRENFYPVLEMGELDLLAEFVDSLRQYGCTPETDLQVRDGSRYLLKVFHDNGGRWMAYRKDGETEADLDDYLLIHKPWTGVTGLRPRTPEDPAPSTYGGLVRRWLLTPR